MQRRRDNTLRKIVDFNKHNPTQGANRSKRYSALERGIVNRRRIVGQNGIQFGDLPTFMNRERRIGYNHSPMKLQKMVNAFLLALMLAVSAGSATIIHL